MQVLVLEPVGCTAQTKCGLRAYKRQRSHSGILGMAGVLRFWFGFSFSQIGVGGDRKWRCVARVGVTGFLKVPD